MGLDAWKAPLRARVAIAVGVVALTPLLFPPDKVVAQDTDAVSTREECVQVEEDATCVPATEFVPTADTSCDTQRVIGEVTFDEEAGSCCYQVQCEVFPPQVLEGCCYGRPYVGDDGHALAPRAARADWFGHAERPELDDLTPADRARLAAHWTRAGLAEQSSVAGFARFALDLMAHGAPADLVLRAQQAGLDETRHAMACFALASAYGGEPVGPGPIDLGTSAPIAPDLVALAVTTAREGCVNETVGAWIAAHLAEQATDPAVRGVLSAIAAEEAEHAALAWATLRWAIEVGGDPVCDALIGAFDRPSSRFSDDGPATETVRAHGLVPDPALHDEIERAMVELVWPAAAELTRTQLTDSPRPRPRALASARA